MLSVRPPENSQGQPAKNSEMIVLQIQDEQTSSQEHLSPSQRSEAAHSGDSFYTARVRSTYLLAMFLHCKLMLSRAFQSFGLSVVEQSLACLPLGPFVDIAHVTSTCLLAILMLCHASLGCV